MSEQPQKPAWGKHLPQHIIDKYGAEVEAQKKRIAVSLPMGSDPLYEAWKKCVSSDPKWAEYFALET